MLPLNPDRYELGFGVVPLPTSDSPTTSTTATTTTVATTPAMPDFTPEILTAELPAHLEVHFAPKLVRVQNVVRLVQYRFDEQQNKFCWHVLSQPLRDPTATMVKPAFRISCPTLDRKFDFESVFWFLRHYNVRSDGTYYLASPEPIPTSRGYNSNVAINDRSTFAPSTDCKYNTC